MKEIWISIEPVQNENKLQIRVDGRQVDSDYPEGLPLVETPFNQKELTTLFKALHLLGKEELPFEPKELELLKSWEVMTFQEKQSNEIKKKLTENDINIEKLEQFIGERVETLFLDENHKRKLQEALQPCNEIMHIKLKFPVKGEYIESLSQIPWEILSKSELFKNFNTCISRYLQYKQNSIEPIEGESINLLVITSRPASLKNDNTRDYKEIEKIGKGKNKLIKCSELPSPVTRTKLFSYLCQVKGSAESPHIIHFDGHGKFGRRCPQKAYITDDHKINSCEKFSECKLQECKKRGQTWEEKPVGCLAFETEGDKGTADWVSVDKLSSIFKENSSIRLVVLNACSTGLSRRNDDIFNGIAPGLRQIMIPAVIGTLFPVSSEKAQKFAKNFYSILNEGKTLIEAMHFAVSSLQIEEFSREWYRYILYLHTKENESENLLKLQGSLTPQDAEEEKVPDRKQKLDGFAEIFQNRSEERNELTEFFYPKQDEDPQRAKTMIISGFPGIGKSALAADIISKNDPNKEKTVYFHKNINFDIVFDCCLKRLDQKERDELRGAYDELKKERSIGKNTTDRIHGLVKNFLSQFKQKGVVVVLNNMEELIENEKIRDEHEDLKILIDESRDPNYNVKFLITSYNRILSYQPEKYLKPLNDEDCVKILKKKLEEKQVVLNFPDIPSDQELKEVVIPVCGIPLAIDLILWGLELHWTWERLREVLKSEPLIKENSFYKKLEGYHDLDKDKVQEIEKIFTRLFEGLHKDLSEEQKRILEILAVFGNASPEAIHDVLRNLKLKLPEEKRKNYADDSLTVEKIESYLNKPNCRPFIQKIQKTLNQREFRNELARQHVLHLLTEEKEYTRKDMEVWCGKYYHYGFGEYHHDECINEERVTWKKKSDIEPYLKASDHYINAEHYEQLANCLFASHGPLRFLIERGEYRDIIRLFGKIPKEKMPDRWGGSFLIYLGIAYLYSGKLRDAKEKLEETQKYPESKDNIFQIEYYQNLGNCLGQLGDIEKAITNVSKSLGIIETLDEREKKDFSRENRGLVYHSLGYWYAFKDLKEAREWLNKARKEFDNSTNSDKEYYHACSLTVLGDTFLYQGEFDTALNKYNDAWSRLKGKNYNRALYDVRCGMASTYLMSQSMGKRVDIDEKEALELFKKYKNPKLSLDFGTYKAHLLLGMLYLRQDNSIKAKKSFKIALNSIKDLIKENECSNSQTGYVNFDAYFCKILAEYGLFLCGEESKFDAKRSAKSAMELWGKTGIIERMEQLFRVFNTKDSLKSLSQEE
ncbi:hypothetical protein U27_05697 [Candidatus Vecturithrix granuli]|uniref:Uncharacterized protein n=1 Tax=Vecturithrix granuli TaxID=1499967 RepID=A0A081C2B7_VECG1|nr:hypothetical protein U27_05697 [Candidatus Vecturithrix granuli]